MTDSSDITATPGTQRGRFSTRRAGSLDVVEFTPTFEQYAFTFGGVAPVRRIAPGTVLRLWSDDAFCSALRSVTDLSSEKVDLRYVNPQTGPFYVEGAEPGDALALHLVSLEPARDWGASATIPFFGGLTSTDRTATLQDALPDTTWIYHLDTARRTVEFQARHSELRVELPLEPMLGTVGVAPAANEVRSSLVPDRFGGNMDTPQMRAGVTCYLGVNVDGAMFSIGDGHYRQGEGESCGTAVEGAMISTVIVELVKGAAPAWPRLEDDEHWLTVGSSRPLEDAWRVSQIEMVTWLIELFGLHKMDAYQLLSQIAEVPVANVVDANYSVVAKARKSLLPAAEAFDGLHRELRARAAQLVGG
jgi:acetamidase/formamidase